MIMTLVGQSIKLLPAKASPPSGWLPILVLETHPPVWGNGLDGIRTRTCDLDGVLCCRYTTGPLVKIVGQMHPALFSHHKSVFICPNRYNRGVAIPCRHGFTFT